jgi:hypothetical protein
MGVRLCGVPNARVNCIAYQTSNGTVVADTVIPDDSRDRSGKASHNCPLLRRTLWAYI